MRIHLCTFSWLKAQDGPPSFLEAFFFFLTAASAPHSYGIFVEDAAVDSFSNLRVVLFTFAHNIATVNSFLLKGRPQEKFDSVAFSSLSKYR